ncbi:hypothetical protein EDC01DRAFT_641210 [Geopyxis carbonaria]|nr:hypothetical protein EDC01DRAFT_641210 [Geopyxis carbonaria]
MLLLLGVEGVFMLTPSVVYVSYLLRPCMCMCMSYVVCVYSGASCATSPSSSPRCLLFNSSLAVSVLVLHRAYIQSAVSSMTRARFLLTKTSQTRDIGMRCARFFCLGAQAPLWRRARVSMQAVRLRARGVVGLRRIGVSEFVFGSCDVGGDWDGM